jgi:hypothetical protein
MSVDSHATRSASIFSTTFSAIQRGWCETSQSGGVVRNPLLRRAWVGSASLRERVRPYVPSAMRDRIFRLVTRHLHPVRLDPALRAELTELYRGDIERLSALVNRDLSHWLTRAG